MATQVLLKNPQTGFVRKGFYGFSWTTLFFSGFPTIMRGNVVLGLIILLVSLFTLGIAGIVWAFIYNKKYTLGLLERGYALASSDAENALAKQKLGVL